LAHIGKGLALFGLYTVPFTFFLPPLAGWLHDTTGGYPAVIACIVAGCGVAAIIFLLIGQKERAQPRIT
jgi:cyanate permease